MLGLFPRIRLVFLSSSPFSFTREFVSVTMLIYFYCDWLHLIPQTLLCITYSVTSSSGSCQNWIYFFLQRIVLESRELYDREERRVEAIVYRSSQGNDVTKGKICFAHPDLFFSALLESLDFLWPMLN